MLYQEIIDACEYSIANLESEVAMAEPYHFSDEQLSHIDGRKSAYRHIIHVCKILRASN